MPDALPRVGSALLVRDELNRVLLGKRNKDPQRGSWVIPGGKIHPFETIAQAATRELAEETGLIVEVQRQFAVYEIVNPPQEHRIVVYSWGKAVGGTPRASDDISELKFFTLSELQGLETTPLVRKVLQDVGFIAPERPQEAPRLEIVKLPFAESATFHKHTSTRRVQKPGSRPTRPKFTGSMPLFGSDIGVELVP